MSTILFLYAFLNDVNTNYIASYAHSKFYFTFF